MGVFGGITCRLYAAWRSRRRSQPKVRQINSIAERPARIRAGRCGGSGLVAVRLAAAGPDQGGGLAVLVVEEVGVDRSVEARIVQLDREIIATLAGALRPGGPDLGAADVDPVARRVVVGPVCL